MSKNTINVPFLLIKSHTNVSKNKLTPPLLLLITLSFALYITSSYKDKLLLSCYSYHSSSDVE
jgi:hypothetical protein